MDNIPPVWTFENLASLFDTLGELANFKYQARGHDFVKAILEIGLTMQPEDINVVYKSDTRDRRFPPRKNFINRFLDYTTGKQINFRHFYKTVFGMKPSRIDVTTFGDAAKLLISWFATYLLLNAFGMKFLCTQMYRRNKCFKLNIDNLCCVDYCFS